MPKLPHLAPFNAERQWLCSESILTEVLALWRKLISATGIHDLILDSNEEQKLQTEYRVVFNKTCKY